MMKAQVFVFVILVILNGFMIESVLTTQENLVVDDEDQQSSSDPSSWTISEEPDQSTDDDQPTPTTTTNTTTDNWQKKETSGDDDDQVHYGMLTPQGHSSIDHHSYPSNHPTPTTKCNGPSDPNTGEATLDSYGNCAIVCYNNLVLTEAKDDCTCPATFELDRLQIKCVCRSPYVQSGMKCILQPSQRANPYKNPRKRPIGPDPDEDPRQKGRSDLDRFHCAGFEVACPMSQKGLECVDPINSLEFCGGCHKPHGNGIDCQTLPGVNSVGCSNRTCTTFSCLDGYQLIEGTCVETIYTPLQT